MVEAHKACWERTEKKIEKEREAGRWMEAISVERPMVVFGGGNDVGGGERRNGLVLLLLRRKEFAIPTEAASLKVAGEGLKSFIGGGGGAGEAGEEGRGEGGEGTGEEGNDAGEVGWAQVQGMGEPRRVGRVKERR
uniref:Uncharacterized protein n=1 Tax=Oryza meridionalis TaxID=40149 RepID=A0A0E0ES03_9ORYZ